MTELEQRLVSLSSDYPFPPTPDLAGAAGARVSPRRTARRPLRAAAVAAGIAALALGGALAFSTSARGALADLLDRVPGVRIERVDELPEMPFWTRTPTAGRSRSPRPGGLRRSRWSRPGLWASPTSPTTRATRRAPTS